MDASTTVTLTIDGREVQTRPGAMVIQAADAAGVYIPRFCYHPKLSIAANCRMCLVEVEKAPKPLPACATPVAEGMVVRTRSPIAVEAQQGTMEFLLINHPLDCPVCDQGGECPLQDQAMGYGQDYSRFDEEKRVKDALDLGPLVATAMTRCIHCTRCVRFGQEIAGTMELGATGRGEAMTIETYLGGSVDSEVSGNIIDLCPVGALTSKPYRFTARPWELWSHSGISPHDSLGTNITLQTANRSLKRVVPRENEAINSCWISDRDRFAYEGAESEDRLLQPLMRTPQGMIEVSWEVAIAAAADAIQSVADTADQDLAALIHPISSLEEGFLLQKILRAVGSSNIDHRLWQKDFTDDRQAPAYPHLEAPLADLPALQGIVLLGANPRKETPLLALRIREMVAGGGKVGVIGSCGIDANFDVHAETLVPPTELIASLCAVISAFDGGEARIPSSLLSMARSGEPTAECSAVASLLKEARGAAAIILGEQALNHAQGATIRLLARILADISGAAMGSIAPANSAGAWWAGAVPHRLPGGLENANAGMDAQALVATHPRVMLLYGIESTVDFGASAALQNALDRAEKIIAFGSFRSAVPSQADIVLPITPYTESAGSYVNLNGLRQVSAAALAPRGNARPGWKVLRVLGNFLRLDGFDYNDIAEVQADIPNPDEPARPARQMDPTGLEEVGAVHDSNGLLAIKILPIYATDPVVRRANALSQTLDGKRGREFALHPDEMVAHGLADGDLVEVSDGQRLAVLPVRRDAKVLRGCILIPLGLEDTALLNDANPMTVRRAQDRV